MCKKICNLFTNLIVLLIVCVLIIRCSNVPQKELVNKSVIYTDLISKKDYNERNESNKSLILREKAVKDAVNNFWRSAQYNDWEGILKLYSNEALESSYKKMLEELQLLLQFPRSEIEKLGRDANDPNEKRTAFFGILYKDGRFDQLRYEYYKYIGEKILEPFKSISIKNHKIDSVKFEGDDAIAMQSYTAYIKGLESKTSMDQKLIQRFQFKDGKWVFTIPYDEIFSR